LEIRGRAGLGLPSPGKLAGHAAVFDLPADIGPFREVVRPGAFARSLQQPGRVLALYDHETRSVLGRASAGTLRLREDDRGLAFEIDLPDTGVGRDLAVLVQRGDVNGCSFGFVVAPEGERWHAGPGKPLRELLDVDLHEVTITPNPAYSGTEVALRRMPARLQGPSPTGLNRLWLETAR
jgi:HK97 family phage prohead protease